MNKTKTCCRIIILTFSLLLSAQALFAQYSEYEIKAAYIFNFAKFIQWPEEAMQTDTLVLAIYKYDPFGIIIDKTMQGRKAQGKNWKIIRIDKIEEITKCHVLFISNIGTYETMKLIEKTKNKPILTIGDEIIGFCEMGGIINFTPQFSSHQFEINNEVALIHKISISPKLLTLAKIISNSEDEF